MLLYEKDFFSRTPPTDMDVVAIWFENCNPAEVEAAADGKPLPPRWVRDQKPREPGSLEGDHSDHLSVAGLLVM
jgi:hypothetical protein